MSADLTQPQRALMPRLVQVRWLHCGWSQAECQVMTNFPGLMPVPSDRAIPHDGLLHLGQVVVEVPRVAGGSRPSVGPVSATCQGPTDPVTCGGAS